MMKKNDEEKMKETKKKINCDGKRFQISRE
jgi:hypothetical protein